MQARLGAERGKIVPLAPCMAAAARYPSAMRLLFLPCLGPAGFHKLAYREWPGPAGAPTLLCVHGLTRNSRDFDVIAQALSAHYRVVCPDMPGRGASDYLADSAQYNYSLYLADLAALIARLDVERLDWLGTSMGGLLGMMMAATPGNPIRRLVVNDIGAVVAKAGLERIASYVGLDPKFDTLEALADTMAANFVGSDRVPRATILKLAEGASRKLPDGRYGLAYDPHIADVFKANPPQDVDLLPVWDRIACPALALRGGVSDLFPHEVAQEMTRRGPKARLVEFEGVGHAPWLATEDQIAPVREFLLA
jgi:pimeloyl-ACP methyl ester carboxylesterase